MRRQALSHFADKAELPSEEALAAVLGASAPVWRDLIARIDRGFAPVTVEWGYSSKTIGWGLRVKQHDRMILSMIPREGHFLASFALGEKAVTRLRESKLPAAVRAAIDGAPKYAEGRGVRIEVRTARDAAAIETIAGAKMAG